MSDISRHKKKQVMGIEPTYSAWKADVLPLNHTCKNYAMIIPKLCAIVNKKITTKCTFSHTVIALKFF